MQIIPVGLRHRLKMRLMRAAGLLVLRADLATLRTDVEILRKEVTRHAVGSKIEAIVATIQADLAALGREASLMEMPLPKPDVERLQVADVGQTSPIKVKIETGVAELDSVLDSRLAEIFKEIAEWRVDASALRIDNLQFADTLDTRFQEAMTANAWVGDALNALNRIELQLAVIVAGQNQIQAAFAQRDRLDLLHQRAVAARAARQGSVAPVDPPRPHSLAETLVDLERRAPLNFASWRRLFDSARVAYEARDPADLSVESHREAFLFRQFIAIYARGRVLDVGVGPLGTPAYLADFAPERLAGLDPLSPFEPHPFAFAQTVAEAIPWPDASFETVVAATSLDHVYLLDAAMEEVARVLTPGGRFLIWTGLFAETQPYDPVSETIQPPDQYHLFHPGENWFPAYLQTWFRFLERLEVGPNNVMFSLERR